MQSIGVIGYGRLGKRLIEHLYVEKPIICLTKTPMQNIDNVIFTQNPENLRNATHIFPCIKPKDLLSVRYKLDDSQFLISPVAGVDIDTLSDMFGGRVLRIMPNIYFTRVPCCWSSEEDIIDSRICKHFDIVEVKEKDMDEVTRLYACTPAIIAWLYKQMNVIDEDLVRDVFENTLSNLEGGSPTRIIEEVRTEGGITAEMIDKLDDIDLFGKYK